MNKIIRPSYTVTFWQILAMKIYLLCIGVAIGAYWNGIFSPYALRLAIVGVALGAIVKYTWLRDNL